MIDDFENEKGQRIASVLAEEIRSSKRILRMGMPNATEEEVNGLVEEDRSEALFNNSRAYYR